MKRHYALATKEAFTACGLGRQDILARSTDVDDEITCQACIESLIKSGHFSVDDDDDTVAGSMLDGLLCQFCGELVDGEAPGYPRSCAGCAEDEADDRTHQFFPQD